MTRLRLPIGIQTFRTIREEGYYYVDKTPDVRRLAKDGTHYFLSRPRRFGKSLFLDTLKELFEGSEPLFRGLAIHDCWDWSARHPVVRLSFGVVPSTCPAYCTPTYRNSSRPSKLAMGLPRSTAPPRVGSQP